MDEPYERHGIEVDVRPTTADECVALTDAAVTRRAGLDRALAAVVRESIGLGIALGVVILPASVFLPLGHDAALLRAAITGVLLLLLAIAVAGAVRGHRARRERLAAFDAASAARVATVTEWRFTTTRVLAATDRYGEGTDWWMFEVPGGFLVLPHVGEYGLDLAARTWRRDVRLVVDLDGDLFSVHTEGEPVPLVDGRLLPPTFEPGPSSAFWSPPEGPPGAPPGPPRVYTREALVAGGEWPAGSP